MGLESQASMSLSGINSTITEKFVFNSIKNIFRAMYRSGSDRARKYSLHGIFGYRSLNIRE